MGARPSLRIVAEVTRDAIPGGVERLENHLQRVRSIGRIADELARALMSLRYPPIAAARDRSVGSGKKKEIVHSTPLGRNSAATSPCRVLTI